MSEATLWDRIRDNIGHRGHFTRLEFNPEAGIPDVDYCVKGAEGKIELKFKDAPPRKSNTPVFHDGGLRDAQEVWIFRRTRVGGRVFILPQVGSMLYLVPGSFCRSFNEMTLHQIAKASTWSAGPMIDEGEWLDLTKALRANHQSHPSQGKGCPR